MRVYRNASELPQNRRLKAFLGSVVATLRPSLAQMVREKPFSGDWGFAGRLIRNVHLAEAVAKGDHRALQRYHQDFWSSSAAAVFYERFSNRFENLFLRHHAGIVDHIATVANKMGSVGVRLVEVGAGDGLVLAHLGAAIPAIHVLHGIDLNPEQVAASRDAHGANPRLHFHHANITDWLKAHSSPMTILLTNGGVFEYLRRDELADLFRTLKDAGSPCAVAITESIGIDHRLDTEAGSYPYGHECALSHNYPRILEEAGFTILWRLDRPTKPGEENHPTRWFQLVAVG